MLRSDYGSTWDGTITLNNVTAPNTKSIVVIPMINGDFGIAAGYERHIPSVTLSGTNSFQKANFMSKGYVIYTASTSNHYTGLTHNYVNETITLTYSSLPRYYSESNNTKLNKTHISN